MFRNRLSGENGVERIAQIFARDWDVISRPALIKLAAIDEFQIFIEEENIRRAGGAISLRDGLRFVVKIRKRVAGGFDFLFHFFRAVVGIIFRVIGIDGDNANSFRLVIAPELREFGANVFHIRTMIADEHHEQRGSIFEIVARNNIPIRVRQFEIGRCRAERQHGGRCQSHVANFERQIANVECGFSTDRINKIYRIFQIELSTNFFLEFW